MGGAISSGLATSGEAITGIAIVGGSGMPGAVLAVVFAGKPRTIGADDRSEVVAGPGCGMLGLFSGRALAVAGGIGVFGKILPLPSFVLSSVCKDVWIAPGTAFCGGAITLAGGDGGVSSGLLESDGGALNV